MIKKTDRAYIRGARSILKFQIVNFDPLLLKDLRIVKRVIQSDYCLNIHLLKVLKERLRTQAVALLCSRGRESENLARDHPVHISNIQFMIVLVQLVVKLLKLVPSILYSLLKPSQAVNYL